MGTRQLPRSALSCAVLALFCALALTSAYAQGVPSGWECAEDQYNDGFFCDCECGVYDPDCAVADNSFCLALETCQNVNGLGSCVPIGEGGSPGGPTIDEEGEGCLVEGSNNFDENAEVPCDDCCVACLEPEAANFVEGAHIPCNDCCNLQADCADPTASNFNEFAYLGTPCPEFACCEYEGCMIEGSISFDEKFNKPCTNCCEGCEDPAAVNFLAERHVSCADCCEYETCNVEGSTNFDEDADVPCDDCCVGCKDPDAENFLEGAHIDCGDECCEYSRGCMKPDADNYNENYKFTCIFDYPGDPCCKYEGCMNQFAVNYEEKFNIPCADCCRCCPDGVDSCPNPDNCGGQNGPFLGPGGLPPPGLPGPINNGPMAGNRVQVMMKLGARMANMLDAKGVGGRLGQEARERIGTAVSERREDLREIIDNFDMEYFMERLQVPRG